VQGAKQYPDGLHRSGLGSSISVGTDRGTYDRRKPAGAGYSRPKASPAQAVDREVIGLARVFAKPPTRSSTASPHWAHPNRRQGRILSLLRTRLSGDAMRFARWKHPCSRIAPSHSRLTRPGTKKG